jgi:hypothetical protein
MRLPSGPLDDMLDGCPPETRFSVLGCLSFERRCIEVPLQLTKRQASVNELRMLRINDPGDAFPDYSSETDERIRGNAATLQQKGIGYRPAEGDLLAKEDQMLSFVEAEIGVPKGDVFVFDISSFPKRWFCFVLRRLMSNSAIENIVVTYTEVGQGGYPDDHLSEDPMPCDHLPGFSGPLPPSGDQLVVSVGFEPLSISSLIRVYRDSTREIKFLLAFSPGPYMNRRQWLTLRESASVGGARQPNGQEIEVVSAWDVEQVYLMLEQWNSDCVSRLSRKRKGGRQSTKSSGLALAPFGPKPHSLGMALFAMKYRCGMYYTQPKAYNPSYSVDAGPTWAYVVKWRGTPCYERVIEKP